MAGGGRGLGARCDAHTVGEHARTAADQHDQQQRQPRGLCGAGRLRGEAPDPLVMAREHLHRQHELRHAGAERGADLVQLVVGGRDRHPVHLPRPHHRCCTPHTRAMRAMRAIGRSSCSPRAHPLGGRIAASMSMPLMIMSTRMRISTSACIHTVCPALCRSCSTHEGWRRQPCAASMRGSPTWHREMGGDGTASVPRGVMGGSRVSRRRSGDALPSPAHAHTSSPPRTHPALLCPPLARPGGTCTIASRMLVRPAPSSSTTFCRHTNVTPTTPHRCHADLSHPLPTACVAPR